MSIDHDPTHYVRGHNGLYPIIGDDREYENIAEYIYANPRNWGKDDENQPTQEHVLDA
ncbi:MAG: hypothetical protein FD147_1332 [Chloroflexi bacterium]|nr:MAG: hypothetical protein FD147_1332 [Chloroflexota bacterium]